MGNFFYDLEAMLFRFSENRNHCRYNFRLRADGPARPLRRPGFGGNDLDGAVPLGAKSHA
jgi:hypothetical protein